MVAALGRIARCILCPTSDVSQLISRQALTRLTLTGSTRSTVGLASAPVFPRPLRPSGTSRYTHVALAVDGLQQSVPHHLRSGCGRCHRLAVSRVRTDSDSGTPSSLPPSYPEEVAAGNRPTVTGPTGGLRRERAPCSLMRFYLVFTEQRSDEDRGGSLGVGHPSAGSLLLLLLLCAPPRAFCEALAQGMTGGFYASDCQR